MGQGKKVEQSNVQNSFTAILTFFRKKSKDLVIIPSGGWIKITLEIEAEVKKKKGILFYHRAAYRCGWPHPKDFLV